MHSLQSTPDVAKIIQSTKRGWKKKLKMSDKWYVIFFKYMFKIVYDSS